VLIETFIRKQLRLKAHAVTAWRKPTNRWLCTSTASAGDCCVAESAGQRCREVHSMRREREWRDLAMTNMPLRLRYRPCRVDCPGAACAWKTSPGPSRGRE
jgi:hypothetical protein